jgi:hypothetical protein
MITFLSADSKRYTDLCCLSYAVRFLVRSHAYLQDLRCFDVTSEPRGNVIQSGRKSTQRMRHRRLLRLCILAGWPAAVLCGVLLIALHDSEPGFMLSSAAAAERLPDVARDVTRPTLTLFIHPRCPCSNASLQAFSELLVEHPGAVRPVVVIYVPSSPLAGWADSTATRMVNALPDVTVIHDYDSIIARGAGIHTSGHVMLVDAAGRLMFTGGITVSRGHLGPNAGMEAISRCLDKRQTFSGALSAPVFGCILESDK